MASVAGNWSHVPSRQWAALALGAAAVAAVWIGSGPSSPGELAKPDATSASVATPACDGPRLLPPQPVPQDLHSQQDSQAFTPITVANLTADSADPAPIAPPTATATEFPDAQALLADSGPTITGSPTGNVVCQRAGEKIRRAQELAQRGALFAARGELLSVLEMIAEAKDQKHGAPRRTIALAHGLRAMEEADDFAAVSPAATQRQLVEITFQHQTTVGRAPAAQGSMPLQLAALYFRYAQVELGAAVANEPVGSMALHSLGKLYSQFHLLERETFVFADRRAFALQQASLLSRPDNYLASHELGVLLAESGHFAEAETTLASVAVVQPNPVVLRNLARVQQKLGHADYAVANEQRAQQIAARIPATASGVAWMPAQAFNRTSEAASSSAYAGAPPAANPYQGQAPRIKTAAQPQNRFVR